MANLIPNALYRAFQYGDALMVCLAKSRSTTVSVVLGLCLSLPATCVWAKTTTETGVFVAAASIPSSAEISALDAAFSAAYASKAVMVDEADYLRMQNRLTGLRIARNDKVRPLCDELGALIKSGKITHEQALSWMQRARAALD